MPFRKHVTRLRWWLSTDREGRVVLQVAVRRSSILPDDELREYVFVGKGAVRHLDRIKSLPKMYAARGNPKV